MGEKAKRKEDSLCKPHCLHGPLRISSLPKWLAHDAFLGDDMDQSVPGKSMFKVDEAARVLGLSKWKVYRYISEGRIEAVRIGRIVRIYRSSTMRAIGEGTRH